MINYIKFIFTQLVFVFGSIPLLSRVKSNNNKDKAFETIHNHTVNSLNKVNINLKILGEENIPNEPVLFVANHASMLDSFILFSSIKRTTGCLISAEGIWPKIPIVSTWLKLINCVYIDRKNNRSSVKSINECADAILSGQSMAVFAEGDLTWVKDPNSLVAEFRAGALKIAYRANCPIVPLVIKNSMPIYEGYEPIGSINSADIEVEFLPPVYEHINNRSLKTTTLSNNIRTDMINAIYNFNIKQNKAQ